MSTYSPSLRIELITTGDQAGVWGNTTNTNLGTLIESAIAGYTSVSITSANQALTALNGVADQSRNMSIALTTTTTAAFNVYAPPAEKTYVIQNASLYTATIYNSTVLGNTTAAGTGVAIPAGKTVTVWSDGTNFAFQNNHLSSLTLATDLAVADGGTGASTAADARTNLDVPSRSGGDASGTWSINVSGNAGTATAPASGGSFITSSNIASQSVAFATNATNSTNSTFASNPASGGSFITSSNIGGQSVNYANSAGSVSTITTAQVLNATAGASADAVGTYAFLVRLPNSGNTLGNALTAGATVTGSVMRFSGTNGTSGTPSGTWRCMGYMLSFYDSYGNVTGYFPTLFFRIS